MKNHTLTPAVQSSLLPVPASLLSLDTIRQLEARWLDETGPGELMQTAGTAVGRFAMALWKDLPASSPVILLVGPGNNGGDALVAGRFLRQAGLTVLAAGVEGILDQPPAAEDARAAWQAWRDDGQVIHPLSAVTEWLWPDGGAPDGLAPVNRSEASVPGAERGMDDGRGRRDGSRRGARAEEVPACHDTGTGGAQACVPPAPALVIDGLFGIGLARPMREDIQKLVRQLDAGQVHVLAIDVPSGLDADRGAPVGGDDAAVIMARQTITMIADKPGLHTGLGLRAAGQVWVAPLSRVSMEEELARVDAEDDATGTLLTQRLATLLMPPRDVDAHKGVAGDVMVVGGRLGMAGAARLAAQGALSAGAGRVWIATESPLTGAGDDAGEGAFCPEDENLPVDPAHPEIMRWSWPGAEALEASLSAGYGDDDPAGEADGGFPDEGAMGDDGIPEDHVAFRFGDAADGIHGHAGGDAHEAGTRDAATGAWQAWMPPMPGHAPVLVAGCGLGRDDTAWQWLQWALDSGTPVVIDADALGLLADDLWDALDAVQEASSRQHLLEGDVLAGEEDGQPDLDGDDWMDEDASQRRPGRATALDVALHEAFGSADDDMTTASAASLVSSLHAGVDIHDDDVSDVVGDAEAMFGEADEDAGFAAAGAGETRARAVAHAHDAGDDLSAAAHALFGEDDGGRGGDDAADMATGGPWEDAVDDWAFSDAGEEAEEDRDLAHGLPDVARVMTPHPLEAARLLGVPVSVVQADRLGSALQLAHVFDSVVVLKGAGTVVAAPDGRYAINTSGHPVLATAGTGDVLAGTIGALLASLLRAECPPAEAAWQAACAGVWLHGHAGERLAVQRGPRGVPAGALPGQYPAVMAALDRRRRGQHLCSLFQHY